MTCINNDELRLCGADIGDDELHLGADVVCRVMPAGDGAVAFAAGRQQRKALLCVGLAPKLHLGDAPTIDFLRIEAKLADEAGYDLLFIDVRRRDVTALAFAAPHVGARPDNVDVDELVARARAVVDADTKSRPRRAKADAGDAGDAADDDKDDARNNALLSPSAGLWSTLRVVVV